jgi:hypothetical protein
MRGRYDFGSRWRGCDLKTVFLSLLALQPAAVESALLTVRRLASAPSTDSVGAQYNIFNDRAWTSASHADLHDMTGHHRYYGQASCV